MEELKNIVEEVDAVSTEETTGIPEPQAEKKYTDADVDAIVSKKLGRERARVAKMQERQQHESALDRREHELDIRERKADARDVLQSRGLPKSLCELLDYSSDESYKASLAAADALVQEIRETVARERARGTVPKSYKSVDSSDPVRDAFRSNR